MGIDVTIVASAEAIASRPSEEMLSWLEELFQDFDIRYGSICVSEDDVSSLRTRFSDDPVGAMLLEKIDALKSRGDQAPHIIELMIGW